MIYILRERGTDNYKIGYTAHNVIKRIKDGQTFCPNILDIVAVIEGSQDLEAQYHAKLADYRIRPNGEWFYCASDVIVSLLGKEYPDNISYQRVTLLGQRRLRKTKKSIAAEWVAAYLTKHGRQDLSELCSVATGEGFSRAMLYATRDALRDVLLVSGSGRRVTWEIMGLDSPNTGQGGIDAEEP